MVGRPASGMISAVLGLVLGLVSQGQGFAAESSIAVLAGVGGAE